MSQRQTINSFFSPVRKCTDGTQCSIVKFCQTGGSHTFTPTSKGTKSASEKRPVGWPKKKAKTEPALFLGDHEDTVRIFSEYELQTATFWQTAATTVSIKRHRSTYSEADRARVMQFLKLLGASVHEASKNFNIL